jgi:ASC-1-like (ASCH) protein
VKILHLTLKKKYFDLIASGEKKEEYREYTPYWFSRLYDSAVQTYKKFDIICFKNGYKKKSPTIFIECKGITSKSGELIDSDYVDENSYYFVIYLGNIKKL